MDGSEEAATGSTVQAGPPRPGGIAVILRLICSIFVTVVVAIAASPAPLAARPRPGAASAVISVEWRRDVWQPTEVRTLDLSGATRTVAGSVVRGGWPRWSPDGTRLGGYQKATGQGWWDRALYEVRADGSGESIVVTAREVDDFLVRLGHASGYEAALGTPFGLAAWGPRGEMAFAALVRYRGPTDSLEDDRYRWRLLVKDAAGLRMLSEDTDAPYDDADPHWSWASGRIVFVRSTLHLDCGEGPCPGPLPAELWTMGGDGSDVRLLPLAFPPSLDRSAGGELAGPVWNRAGSRIAVTGNLPGEQQTPQGDLWIIDAGSGVVRAQEADPTVREASASWSADDASLVFVRCWLSNARTTTTQVVVTAASPTASDVVITQSTKQGIGFPDWRPTAATS